MGGGGQRWGGARGGDGISQEHNARARMSVNKQRVYPL